MKHSSVAFPVFILGELACYSEAQQVISESDDVTICEGEGAVFTCVLNSTIRSDDVQWYRFIKNTSTTVMVDPNGENINFLTHTNGSTANTSLTITNAIKSYTGYLWVRTPSLNVCNASLTVLGRPPALTVNIIKNMTNSSIVVQWDAMDDFLYTTYTVTWTDDRDLRGVDTVDEPETSYTITGLTLDTVYTINVYTGNRCGDGPEFSTSVSLSTDTTSTTSTISLTVTASAAITSTANPSSTTTTTAVTSSCAINTTTITTLCTITTVTTDINCSIVIPTAITYPSITTTTNIVDSPIPTDTSTGGETSNLGLSTGAAVAIASAVTFILTLTVTAIITFIVTYVCVKSTLDNASNTHNLKHHSPGPQEKVLYEQVRLPSHTVTKNDLELQPNPAYGTSHKVAMDTNPAYESYK